MSLEEPFEVKNWKKERVLGSGGFGTVTLWKQKNGDQMIALKKCCCGADTLLNSKQKERWKKEVEIMQRLKHPNVVRALPLPEDLAKLTSELPMLCMEYCSKGDLRQLLNRPENCCGLPEYEVRRLIQNVSSAVSYLHSEKITHRDLKPENIVLSQSDVGIVYKLIDLGYAKELDQSSICTSFVGTLQYLAPELFTNEKYSSSVDYWSLGLVSHEVITGLRPFLPNMAPVAWMKHVRKKSPEHICAYQTQDGKIEFSSHLFPQNHISSVLKTEMESWLKLVLEWDPRKRGRNATGEVIVFTKIESIMSKKIVRVFCLVTYERLSYEVDEMTTLLSLKTWIERDTKIPSKDQELLLANGQQIDTNSSVSHLFNGHSNEAVFVCKRGSLELPTVPPNLPELVANLLQYPREKIEYIHQRRAYSHAAFFLQQESRLYRDFLIGCRLKLLSVVLRCQRVTRESQKVTDQMSAISAKRELLVESFKFDLAHARRTKLESLMSTWQHQVDSINKKWSENHDRTQNLTLLTQKATKAARKLQTAPSSSIKDDPALNSFLKEGLEILDRLRKKPNSERSTLRDSLDMVKILYNFLKQRDCLLHDQTYNGYLRQVIDCESELTRLLPELESMVHQLDLVKQEIHSANHERQRNIWEMMNSLSVDRSSSPGCTPNPYSPADFTPFLYRSLSSRSLYTEDNPPPVPPHGLGSSTLGASTQSLFKPFYPVSRNASRSSSLLHGAVFDVSENQQPCFISNGCNETISGSNLAASRAKSSVFSIDDIAESMINENKSLRVQTQELMMANFTQFKKVLNEDRSFDWSFLKANTL